MHIQDENKFSNIKKNYTEIRTRHSGQQCLTASGKVTKKDSENNAQKTRPPLKMGGGEVTEST
jgi:hypothetical protein